MMMPSRITGLVLLGLLAIGCSKTEDPLEVPTAPRGTISATQASSFTSGGGKVGTSASSASNDGGGAQMQGLNSSSPASARRVMSELGLIDARMVSQIDEQIARQAARASSCTTTITPTTPVDADSDKVPATRTTDVVCALSESGIKYNSSFSVRETDTNDADPFSAVSVELPLADYSFDFASVITGKGKLAGKADLVTDATSKKRTWAFKWGQTGEWNVTSEGKTQTIEYGTGMYLDGTRLPNAPSSPFGDGTLSFTGFYKYKAKVGAETLDIVLGVTGELLALVTTGCSGATEANPKPKTGTLSMKDTSNNVLLGTYENCTLKWTYNGAAVSR